MVNPDNYHGREQTYVKHIVLENYVERVAFNILSRPGVKFLYVDGFSGPWQSDDEELSDTSFSIALSQLGRVKAGLEKQGKAVDIACVFVEKSKKSYARLQAAAEQSSFPVQTFNKTFEESIPEICATARDAFSLVFIDPTGWTGYALEKIKPLLGLRGEVLINFMFNHINRFLDHPGREIANSLNELFGGPWYDDWKRRCEAGLDREEAILDLYMERLKTTAGFRYVTATRILVPTKDRTYFYLIYGTRHWKGIKEFRGVEEKAVEAQEQVRIDAKLEAELEKTGQPNLFAGSATDLSRASYLSERQANLMKGQGRLDEILRQNPSGIKFQNLIGEVMQIPMVWEKDLKGWIAELADAGKINIPALTGRQRVPQPKHLIIPNN